MIQIRELATSSLAFELAYQFGGPQFMVHLHTCCAGMRWAALVTQYFSGGIHTLSYLHSPSHPIPACVNSPLQFVSLVVKE